LLVANELNVINWLKRLANLLHIDYNFGLVRINIPGQPARQIERTRAMSRGVRRGQI